MLNVIYSKIRSIKKNRLVIFSDKLSVFSQPEPSRFLSEGNTIAPPAGL